MEPGARINSRSHAARRARLQSQLGEGVAILPGATEGAHPFRQDPDLRYLTGFHEPDAVAVLTAQRFLLFVRPRDRDQEIWTGRRTGTEGAVEQFGADEAFPISELGDRLPDLLENAPRVWYRYGDDRTRDDLLQAALAKDSIRGRCYHLNLLIQIKTADEKEDYGTVSAQFSIRAGAEIDFGEATYEVKVEATGPIVFDLDDEPEDPARRQQAIELFDEFKAGVIWQYETIIDELNIKRRLLNKKDLADLHALAAGEPLFINKMITIDWYDEQKTVNVTVAATVAGIDDPDGPTDQPMDFFESDEDWSYSPDAGDESEVVP